MGKRHNSLVKQLEEINEKETILIKKLNRELSRERKHKRESFFAVANFSFLDFVQAVIGCSVFGLPAFINTSFWGYLPLLPTNLLLYIHIFFIGCVFFALNFEYRDDFSADWWFFAMLTKRFLYTYVSVSLVIVLLLILVNKMNYSLVNLEVFRNYLAAQSVGLFGAVTFSFLKK